MSTTSLAEAIARQPRIPLGNVVTPLEEAPRLSKRLGVRVLIKRDDLTGLALGGNKVRKLEFLIAHAQSRNADTIVTTGGSQSNHARLTAAACRRAGLACYLVLDRGIHPEEQGNLLLDHLFLANVKLIESQEPTDAAREMQDLSDRLETEGRTVFIIPRGGSIPAGATGYAAMIPELLSQIADAGEHVTDLYLATGSCGTHSGVMAGLTVSESDIAVQGISVSRPEHLQREKVVALGNETLRHLGLTEQIDPEKVRVDDGFVGPGYGKPTAQCMEAINILAADEGMVLDPVYTAKAMAGLIEHTRSGKLSSSDTVVFVHTGGSPALFAYHAEAEAALATTEA